MAAQSHSCLTDDRSSLLSQLHAYAVAYFLIDQLDVKCLTPMLKGDLTSPQEVHNRHSNGGLHHGPQGIYVALQLERAL